MSRLEIPIPNKAQLVVEELYRDLERRIESSPSGLCPIDYEAANMVYKGLQGFREEYEAHIEQGRCTCTYQQPVPCVSLCPAGVDIPGYIALVYRSSYAYGETLRQTDGGRHRSGRHFRNHRRCDGGGGQPIKDGMELADKRSETLRDLDKQASLRFSHENPDIVTLYEEFLEKPLSHKAHLLLHTEHEKK